MMHKGLSHYQSVQKRVTDIDTKQFFEKIIDKASLYNIVFLQNRAIIETILELPEEKIDAPTMQKIEKLLSWLHETQEEASLS